MQKPEVQPTINHVCVFAIGEGNRMCDRIDQHKLWENKALCSTTDKTTNCHCCTLGIVCENVSQFCYKKCIQSFLYKEICQAILERHKNLIPQISYLIFFDLQLLCQNSVIHDTKQERLHPT